MKKYILNDEEKKKIVELHAKKYGYHKISKMLSVSRHSVRNFLIENNIEFNNRYKELSSDDIKLIHEMYAKRPSCKKIAKNFSVGYKTIKSLLIISGKYIHKEIKNKVEVSEEQKNRIISLVNQGYGSRLISKDVGISRGVVHRILKKLNIKISKNVSRVEQLTHKICKRCKEDKSIECFYRKKTKSGKTTCSSVCKICNTIQCNEYRSKNYEKRFAKEKEYRKNNRDKINKSYNKYTKERYDKDPAFKLRRTISSWIAGSISKKDAGCFKSLGYSSKELKQHLEAQFEDWMSWDNRGKFDPKTWDDNDPITWKWQIDHIIPHSEFQYNSVNDDDFKKCWALDNLRPLSAKQNVIDGVSRSRHANKNIK